MRITLFLPALALCALADAATVRFSKDIRPIFSDKCFTCHGPDASNRTTKLRLDTERGARIDSGSGRKIIVPGDPASSELYLRVSSGDPARRMPPAYAGHAGLTQSEIDLIETWIDQGAEWSGHWAFVPPQSPRTPAVRQADWVKNPIDAFVLKRLETEGLSPSPQAARETLIRRVSLDLNGLPPSLEEIDAFLADRSANAYEKVVDRLLSSPRYGERMAARWLDAARYADTNGYQTDAERYMWRWRDWVIDAFNANKPFDEFTVEQLAGDMLPNATLEQIVATGFNRNHRGNGEGGIVDAEYAVEYVVDRVDTTSTVWLGITMGCARCHDHKYDPFTQKEFYGMFAYFNNVPERGKAFKYGNSPPFVQAPTAEQQETLAAMSAEIDSLKRRRARLIEEGRRARLDWERSAAAAPADWTDARGQVAAWGSEAAEAFDGKRAVELGDIADFSFYDRFTASAWIRPAAADGAIVSRTRDIPAEEDTQSNPGWGFYLKDGRLQVNLVNRWLDDCLRIDSEPKIARNEWRHVAFTYDGSRLASGLNLYIDGKPVAKKIVRDEMNQEIKSKEPLTIGRGLGLGFQGLMKRVSVWSRALTPEEIAVEAVRERIDRLAAVPGERRSPAAQRKLDRAYANRFGPAELTALTAKIRGLEDERQRFSDSIPTVMVMRERRIPRKTYRLDRGAYDAPAEEVQPGAPAVLARQSPRNRLEFARWTASRDNPLTARVTVNRLWQMLFGTGIVKTVEDFGAQGEWPTHPQLLDWLAVEFMESGWDVKHILKTIVASAAYRQSSRTGGELIERDPENRLLARGPRFRLPAEAVRDQALAISGLLVEKIGGPSVKPYQPPGLWSDLAGTKDYQMDKDENLYRRSLYTFWKRAVPPPAMMNFDSAGREACTVRAVRTNTPLQALNLMNDFAFVEAARALAARAMREADGGAEARLSYAFRLAAARRPSPDELAVLVEGFRHQRSRFAGDEAAAEALLAQGARPPDAPLPPAEWAAYTTMASLILNLDETITKE